MSSAVNDALELSWWERVKLSLSGEIRREGIVNSVGSHKIMVDGIEYWMLGTKNFKVGAYIEFTAWGHSGVDNLSVSSLNPIRIIKE